MIAAALLAMTALPTGARAADSVNLAVIAPLSGSNASVGEMVVRASKLAVEDINAGGGIKALGGAKLELVIADSGDNPQGAITTTERVLSQNKIAGAFGLALSPLTTAALPAFIKHHVPVVTSSIADTLVTPANGGYLFQIAPKGSAFGHEMVEFLGYLNKTNNLHLTKAAILYVNNPYGQATQKGIEQLARDAGLEVVLSSPYPETITDASPLVTKVAQSGAEILFPISYIADSSLILTALRAADSHVLVIGGGAGFIWPSIGESLGDKVNGLVSSASWNFDAKNVKADPKLVAVTERYAKLYGGFMPEQAGEAYAAIAVLAGAVETAGSAEPVKVRDALARTDVKNGGSMMQPGEVAFDANGANTHVMPVIIQWQGGAPRTVFPPEVATATATKP